MSTISLVVVLFRGFVPINGFSDLDALAAPTDFGFLVIESGSTEDDTELMSAVENGLDEMSVPDSCQVKLYTISPGSAGYPEVARLAGSYNGFPAVVVIVGHCGFIELDTEFLVSEMEDAWYRWGSGGSMGICNHCRRCNP